MTSSSQSDAVRGVHFPVPGFAAPLAVETLANADIKLSAGPGQNRPVRFVVHDNDGWAAITIESDGSIDSVRWERH